MEQDKIIALAQIHSIKDTWTNTDAVTAALERLQKPVDDKPKTSQQHEFQFVIDDNNTYYRSDDFRSPQAKALHNQYVLLEKSYKQQQEKLAKMRSEYANAGKNEKDGMSAAILDLEKRVQQLSAELEQAIVKVRNTEKQVIK